MALAVYKEYVALCYHSNEFVKPLCACICHPLYLQSNQVVTKMTQFDVKTGNDIWEKLATTGQLDTETSRYGLKQGEVGVAISCMSLVESQQCEEMVFSLVWHEPLIHFKGKQRQYTRLVVLFVYQVQNCSSWREIAVIFLQAVLSVH